MTKSRFIGREREIKEDRVIKNDITHITYIDIDNLEMNPYQPRLNIDEDKLQELSNSIERDGLQSPIKVTRWEGYSTKYIIVFGHRRVEAHKRLGLTKIKAFIEETSKSQLRRLALIENVQRDDLNIIELAISFDNAINDGTYSSQKELAEALGFKTSKVSECLSLLKLQEKITKDLEKDRTVKDITALAALNKIDNNHTQWDLYKRFKAGELDRKGLLQIINSENIKPNSQCELTLNKSKLSFLFRPNKDLTKKGKYLEYERFAKEKLELLQRELQDKEKELLS